MDAQLLKVISVKTMTGLAKTDLQKLVLENQTKNVPLFRVYGEATGYVSGEGKFKRDDGTPSTWNKLAGDFEAVRFDTGEIFQSAMCFLPDYVTAPILKELGQEGVQAVQFAYDILLQFDPQSATSYIFLAKPLRANAGESAVDKLRAALPPPPSAQGQIAGPKKGK